LKWSHQHLADTVKGGFEVNHVNDGVASAVERPRAPPVTAT
jgi:hypothetical protein